MIQPYWSDVSGFNEKFGFTSCGPFADYVDDPDSAYYTKTL
jgi:hypothetical protein